MILSIVTPTYNRAYKLPRLYQSLQRQSSLLFEWIVVDDGSTDHTYGLFESWLQEKAFSIKYFQTENKGKHCAVNEGVRHCSGKYVLIVDSDDFITPDAVDKILSWIDTLREETMFAGVAGMKGSEDGKTIGQWPKGRSGYIDASNLERRKKGLLGDKAEIYRKDVLTRYPFAEFAGEKFLTEQTAWNAIAVDGLKIRWFPDIIYICEYLDDGLTARASKLLKENFEGLTLNTKQIQKWGTLRERMSDLSFYYLAAKEKGLTLREIAKRAGISRLGLVLTLPFAVLRKLMHRE